MNLVGLLVRITAISLLIGTAFLFLIAMAGSVSAELLTRGTPPMLVLLIVVGIPALTVAVGTAVLVPAAGSETKDVLHGD